jgi:ParB/RepB/Spo0J family partition protein
MDKAMIQSTEVVHIPLAEIDLDDRSFMFRVALRTADLQESIAAEGQQIPIIVRPTVDGRGYQLISGYRRATAMRELGLDSIAAIVRHDLDDDELAFRAAIIENEQRQTYSDIDRALAIIRYQQAGWSAVEVQELMGLGRRQRFNLMTLLTLSQAVQAAIDDPGDHFGATHGLALNQLARRYPQLDEEHWIARVNAERISVAKLRRAVHKEYRPAGPPKIGSIFNDQATDRANGVYRFDAVKVVIAQLDQQEREQLRSELRELLRALT